MPFDEPPDPDRSASPAWVVARSSWPHLPVDSDRFASFLQERDIDDAALLPPLATDLYLTFACFCRLPGALDAFRLAYTPVIAAMARSFDPSPAFADDVQQKVHEILFVGTAKGGPRIAQYRGQGTLASWVRITARRSASPERPTLSSSSEKKRWLPR